MESTIESKESDVQNRTFYYFDDIIKAIDINNIKKNYERIYDISYKTLTGAKPLCIRCDKVDGFIKIQDRIRYLVLFDYGRFEKIHDNMKYLISEKICITDSINHNFARIRIDSDNSLPNEKILTFHNVIILIKSVVNKNKNEYYYNISLEKGSYKDKCNTEYF